MIIVILEHKQLIIEEGALPYTNDLLKHHRNGQISRAVNGNIWRAHGSAKFAEEDHSSTRDKTKQLEENNYSTQETPVPIEECDKTVLKTKVERILEARREYFTIGIDTEPNIHIRQLGIPFFHPEVASGYFVLGLVLVSAKPITWELLKDDAKKDLIGSIPMVKGFEIYGVKLVPADMFLKGRDVPETTYAELFAFENGSNMRFSQYGVVDQHLKHFLTGGELLTIATEFLLPLLGRNLIMGNFSEIPFDPGVVISSFPHITLEDKVGLIGKWFADFRFHSLCVLVGWNFRGKESPWAYLYCYWFTCCRMH